MNHKITTDCSFKQSTDDIRHLVSLYVIPKTKTTESNNAELCRKIMEAIIINAEEWRTLLQKINQINAIVEQLTEQQQPTNNNAWLNDEQVCELLKISIKTLYRLRKSGDISYSTIAGKHYYKASAIDALMEKKTVRSTVERINELKKRK